MSDINVQSFSGKVKVSNDLTVTTNVHADYFKGDGSLLTNLPSGSGGVWNTNSDNEIYFISSNVGISNADPGHNLSVGSNLYVDDDGSNVLVVTGNVKADHFVGDGSLLTGLSGSGGVWSTNAANEIYFINNNVGISNADPGHNLSVGSNLYVDDDGLDVLVVTGNVNATYLKGNGSMITNLPSGSGGVWSTNADNEIYFISSNVGISNSNPGHNLSVGSNLYVDDDGSNVLVVDGNIAAESIVIGGISIVPSYPLSLVTETGNITPHTIQFTNATTGLVVSSNIVVTGNVTAAYLHGDASNVTGITSNLHQIAENGNVTSNTLQFTNATTGFVTTANVEVGGELTVSSNLTVTGNATVSSNLTVTGNVLVSDDLTVTGNVLVSDDLTVTGNVADLNIVSNVNMLHTSNTASIKLNSNVVTEFPRSKKLMKFPRVAMTGPSAPTGYVASSSTVYVEPYKAFDTILYTSYFEPVYNTNPYPNADGAYTGGSGTVYNTNGYEGDYLQLQLPEKIKLYEYSISKRGNQVGRFPKDAKIFASNDGSTWIDIHTISNNVDGGTVLFKLTHLTDIYYSYYRLVVNSIIQGGTSDTPNISDWSLYGIPEYDPEADGVDVVVKSVPNVPNTDWLEVYYDGQDYTSMPATVTDKSGNNRTGTPSGGVGFDTGYKAFTFDGKSNQLNNISTTTTITGGDWVNSVSVWFKVDEAHTNLNDIFTIGPTTTTSFSSSAFVGVLHSNRLYIVKGGNDQYIDFIPVINTWYHFVYTYSGGGNVNLKMYLNGVSQGTTSRSTVNVTLPTSVRVMLGSYMSGHTGINGSIANFRLFNRALTTDEIYQLYAYQKEYFGHGTLGMTLKAGRLGIGTSEPRAALDVRGDVHFHNVPHMYAIDSGGYDGANGAYVNFDTVLESCEISLEGSDGTFRITESAGAGIYAVRGSVAFHESNGTEIRNLNIYIHVNNTQINARGYPLTAMKHVTGSTYADLGVSALARCNVGDTIRLYATSGSSSINVHTPNNTMIIYKIQSI